MKKIDLDSSKGLFVIINLVMLVSLFFFTKYTPLYSDDISHAMMSADHPITKLTDIFISSRDYYFEWGGRLPSHIIFQYLIVFNRRLYDIINPLAYIVYVMIIYYYANYEKISNIFLVIVYSFLWIYTPSYGGVYLWLTGSVTYLWFMVPILFIGLYYKMRITNSIRTDKYRNLKKILLGIGLFIGGIISGWSIESASCSLVFALLIYFVYKKHNNEKIYILDYAGFVGVAIGWALLMFAPGNYARANVVEESTNILIKYIFRICRETYYSCMYISIPFGLSISLFLLTYFAYNIEFDNRKFGYKQIVTVLKKNKDLELALFFILLALVSIYVMTFSPAFANRIFITPLALLTISIGISLKSYMNKLNASLHGKVKVVLGILVTFVAIYSLTQMVTAAKVCSFEGIPIEKYINFHYPEAELGIW